MRPQPRSVQQGGRPAETVPASCAMPSLAVLRSAVYRVSPLGKASMSARLLWFVGLLLVALGLAAHLFGWDALLRIPTAAIEVVRSNPWTYGVVAVGIVLMVVARMLGRRRG
jgi:hypothetical protein